MTAFLATFFETTTAQRKDEEVWSTLAESTVPRRERPRASTSLTSSALSRRAFGSMGLDGNAGAALAATAYQSLSASGTAFAREKSVRTSAFALFWFIRLGHR